MADLKQELSFLMLGQQGGENRIKILELLRDRSYNLNQLANTLDLNYRTIKYHVDIMLEYGMIESSGEGYGQVYFISPELEKNYALLEDMKKKLNTVFKSPKLYEKVVEQTHEGIIVLDENKDIIFLNKSAKDITGYKGEDLLGKDIKNLLEANIQDTLEDEVLSKDGIIEKTVEINTKSGEKKTVVLTMNFFYFNGEEHKGFSILMNDITKEKEQEEILNALTDHSEIMFAYLDEDFDVVYVNSTYADMTDHTPEELVGKNHFELFPNEDNRRIFRKVLDDGESKIIKDRGLFSTDGSDQKDTVWAVEPFKDDEEKVKGLVLSLWNHP